MSNLSWTEQDAKAVDIARVLAADAVEKVGNGHPGTAVSLAPVAYLLYAKLMKSDPSDPRWLGRDRFVMSAGHSSLTQYAQLYLNGFGLEIDDIAGLRTWESITPGHPEFGLTKGIECTTGPLGAGVANSVGFAMSARRSRELFDPGAVPGESVFDHNVYCIAGDGCMQEGVSERGVVPGRHPEPWQPVPDLRRQPDLDRGRDQDRVLRGRPGPLRRLRLGHLPRRLHQRVHHLRRKGGRAA